MKDNTVNLSYFKEIDSNIKAYLLGFIAADGAIVRAHTNCYVLTITIHRKDIAVLELLKKELNSSLTIKPITFKSKSLSSYKLDVDHVRFSIGRKEIVTDLQRLGITPRKSLTMTNIMNNVPDEFKPAFIIGYFDGDGCFTDAYCTSSRKYISKRTGKETVHTCSHWVSCISIKGSLEFLEGIGFYLETSYKIKKINGQKIHTLKITSNQGILKFYSYYTNCTFYLARKKAKFERKILQVQTMSSTSPEVAGCSC